MYFFPKFNIYDLSFLYIFINIDNLTNSIYVESICKILNARCILKYFENNFRNIIEKAVSI